MSKQDITVMSKLILAWWKENKEDLFFHQIVVDEVMRPEFVEMAEEHLKQE